MYFDITPDYITPGDNKLTFTVTYYDEGTDEINLHYNGSDASIVKAYVFDRTDICERVTKTITVTDAGFDNLFHGGFCDIRFYTDGSPLYVSEVTLIK